MKFNQKKIEVKRILEMHYRERNKYLVNEQNLSIKERLQKIIDSGVCVKNANPGSDKSLFVQEFTGYAKPEYQYAIAQESSKNPGKFRYLFIDNKIGMVDATGKFSFVSTWSCDPGMRQVDQSRAQIQKDTSGAKTAQEWLSQDKVDVFSNPERFEKIENMGGATLYKMKAIGDIGGSTVKQKEILDRVRNVNGKFENEVTDLERATWQKTEIISPNEKNVDYPKGLYVYIPPDEDSRSKSLQAYTDARSTQRLNDKEVEKCADLLQKWYDDWYSSEKYDATIQGSIKPFLQRCVYQVDVDRNILQKLVGVDRNLVKIVKKLTGQEEGGPSTRDPYFLQPRKG